MDKKKIIEAALFMSPKAIPIEELGKTIGEGPLTAKETVEALKQEFNARDSAIEVVSAENSYQMCVRKEFEQNVKQFASEAEFNKSTQKTLALIAFKQPIKQSLVIKLRNVKGYDHIKTLVEKGLIAKYPAGKTFILKTTKKFLEQFGNNYFKQPLEQMPEGE
jgi:segregation and condensation protein B